MGSTAPEAAARTHAGAAAVANPPPSTDPYIASLRYARCMRRHGVPHPDPDQHGDFSLTPADEKRMSRVDPKRRKAAEDACFHHLEGLNLAPLSPHAIALATRVVADLGRCLRSFGHEVGAPQVRNLGRGRASFGFADLPTRSKDYWQSTAGRREAPRLQRDQLVCEKRVRMAARLNKIIADDRRRTDPR
jgi:hypothetical protein